MRQAMAHLGHPRHSFNLTAHVGVQLIGSGARLQMQAETLQAWDLILAKKSDQRHGFNLLSLVEVWMDDRATGEKLYCLAKFLQEVSSERIVLRIVDIDDANREVLERLLAQAYADSPALIG